MSTNSTVPSTASEKSAYNYDPSFVANIVFCGLFALSTVLHIVQCIYHRPMWWLFPTIILGGCGEIVGYLGRIWSSISDTLATPFFIQITTTIISPTFMLAANFIIVGRLIIRLGPQYSRLRPRLYTIVFCSCDIVALIIQSYGGAQASGAKTASGSQLGSNIMLGGIIFQLIAITLYSALTFEFVWRFFHKKAFAGRVRYPSMTETVDFLDTKLSMMLFYLGLSSLCMFIRAIYRTAELADGWNGKIISTEIYFLALDGGMIITSMFALNVMHPGRLLQEPAANMLKSSY